MRKRGKLWVESDWSRSFSIERTCITIDHVTVVCLVPWPVNEREAKEDLVLKETSLLFLCKFQLISMRTKSLTQGQIHPHFSFEGRPGN